MKRKIMEGMEFMDQKYIDEAVAPRAKVLSYKPLLRWGAAAACLVLVLSLCIGSLAPAKETVLPPARYGAGYMEASLARSYTIEEAFSDADAIAWIRVGSWLGERDHPLACTFFDAEVIQCYKGEIPENFVLKQLGSSAYTFRGYPLFTAGNEMLLFLKNADLEIDNEEYDNCFIIMGTFSTVMDISKDQKGDIYVSDRFGMLGKSVVEDYGTVKNHASAPALQKELADSCAANDAIQSACVNDSRYIFCIEEIENMMTDFKKALEDE